jgi:hypothetical protein
MFLYLTKGKKMAKRVTTKVTEETVEGAPEPIVPIEISAQELTPEETEFSEYLSSLGPSTNIIKIHKFIDGSRKYCGRAEPAALIREGEEYILRKWGGGRYYLMSYLNNQYVHDGSRLIEIYESPEERQTPMKTSSSESMLLREEIQRQHEMVLRLLDGQKQTPQPGPSLSDIIAALGSMRSFIPQPPDITKMLPGLVDFIKLAKETAVGSESSGWAGTIQSALTLLPSIMGGIASMKTNSGAPSPAGQDPAPRALNPEEAEKKLLSHAIEYLKTEAISGMDPGLVVDWISNHMEQPIYRNMAVILLNRQFETLFQVDKDLEKEPLRSWFLKVYTDLRKVLIDDNPNSETEIAAGSVGR